MARDSGTGGSCLSRSERHTFPLDPGLHAQAFQAELLQLKKQHEIQQQVLLQRYHSQQQHLAEQHEQQLRLHLKVIIPTKRKICIKVYQKREVASRDDSLETHRYWHANGKFIFLIRVIVKKKFGVQMFFYLKNNALINFYR